MAASKIKVRFVHRTTIAGEDYAPGQEAELAADDARLVLNGRAAVAVKDEAENAAKK